MILLFFVELGEPLITEFCIALYDFCHFLASIKRELLLIVESLQNLIIILHPNLVVDKAENFPSLFLVMIVFLHIVVLRKRDKYFKESVLVELG